MDYNETERSWLEGTAMEGTAEEVTVNTLIRMAADVEKTLIETGKVLNEKRTTLTGNGTSLLGVSARETADKSVDTLYSLLRRISNVSANIRQISVNL